MIRIDDPALEARISKLAKRLGLSIEETIAQALERDEAARIVELSSKQSGSNHTDLKRAKT